MQQTWCTSSRRLVRRIFFECVCHQNLCWKILEVWNSIFSMLTGPKINQTTQQGDSTRAFSLEVMVVLLGKV